MIWIPILVFGIPVLVLKSTGHTLSGLTSVEISDSAQQLSCELPPYPKNGAYALTTEPELISTLYPGRIYIRVVCDPEYTFTGAVDVYCDNGKWSGPIAKCVKYCPEADTFGIQYFCKNNEKGFTNNCDSVVATNEDGTTLYPRCVLPYYNEQDLPPLHCRGTEWSYKPKCTPVCGLQRQLVVTTLNSGNIFSAGWIAYLSELPWHVGIYNKLYEPYMQICGGSVIGRNAVVSAAHCFWSDMEGLQPPSRFAVAGGKLYRPWNLSFDDNAQMSDVDEIVISPRFWGAQTNFQDDIALVFLKTHFDFNRFVWPICIDFNIKFDNKHLSPGNSGISAVWGLIKENGSPLQKLQVSSLPYVDTYKCIANAEPDYRVYITSDKFCAGYTNGSAACIGNSGGGLAFLERDGKGDGHYYLRGIVSISPTNGNLCNTFAISTFTRVSKHEELFERNYHKIVW